MVKLSSEDAKQEHLAWFTKIKNCLAQNGILSLHIDPNRPGIKDIDVKLYNRLKDIFYQESFSSIRKENSKLRTYSLIKDQPGMEDYLKRVQNHRLRSELTKLRLSNHKLMIEVGRHQKIPLENRFCPFCSESVEDEIHFLVTCGAYKDLRKPLLEKCINLKTTFPYYTDQQKFISIMTTPTLTFDLTRFVSNAIKKRSLPTWCPLSFCTQYTITLTNCWLVTKTCA